MSKKVDDLAAQAHVLLARADDAVPLTKEQWEQLARELEAIAKQAKDPDDVRDLYGEHLAWLEPGGKFQDPDYA